jgi:hypothetical protein
MDAGSRNFIMQQERAKKIEEIKKVIETKNKKNENLNELIKNDNNNNTIKEKMD